MIVLWYDNLGDSMEQEIIFGEFKLPKKFYDKQIKNYAESFSHTSLSCEKAFNEFEEYKKELFGLRFQQATGQLENTARIRTVRKSIARIKTIIRERELNQ